MVPFDFGVYIGPSFRYFSKFFTYSCKSVLGAQKNRLNKNRPVLTVLIPTTNIWLRIENTSPSKYGVCVEFGKGCKQCIRQLDNILILLVLVFTTLGSLLKR